MTHEENFELILETFVNAIPTNLEDYQYQELVDTAGSHILDYSNEQVDFWAERIRNNEYEGHYNKSINMFCFLPNRRG